MSQFLDRNHMSTDLKSRILSYLDHMHSVIYIKLKYNKYQPESDMVRSN